MIPDVSVSIVSHDSDGCIGDLLDQLERSTGVTMETLVFDNASRDGTRDVIRRRASIDAVFSDENTGYSRAHNHNIGRSRGRYVLLLNPDVRFGGEMVSSLVAHLDSHPEQAMAGPAILEGSDKRHFPPRRFYPGEGMIALEPGIRRSAVAWINGCCILARRRVLDGLGGFDEEFFLYQAETDLCLRARRAGYTLGWVPGVIVHHLHRQSQRGTSEYDYSRRLFEGSAVFWRKHYSRHDLLAMAEFQLALANAVLVLGRPFDRMLPARLKRERLRARRDVCAELRSSIEGGRAIPSRTARISSRQSRLAFEWLLQGRFPLDDY